MGILKTDNSLVRMLFKRFILSTGIIVALATAVASKAAEPAAPRVGFVPGEGNIMVEIGGRPVATYCYQDDKITRPYFANVHAPSGAQVTRHHPPIAGQDVLDHDTFHPGLWMAFGDISGSDYWRLKVPVRQAEIVEPPHGGPGQGTFAVRNEYVEQSNPSNVVCRELARYTFQVRPAGYLLLWDSTFSSDKEFYFGDQEEMGLGIRVATPLRVDARPQGDLPAGNGAILDSMGRKNEKEVGGNSADWCDYSGTLDGQHVGITILCHPGNLRPSWFHARDYGLLEANQFGRQAFRKGDVSKVVVKPGEELRLRYGILIHSGPTDSAPDLAAAYQDYLRQAGN